jgi:NAD(P)-dependent dehydrogenase (short-subunit alcohol dehydrogenase family)
LAPLTEKVALVTGGSRGAGRGIAVELAKAGATVYVTGRSLDQNDPERAFLSNVIIRKMPTQKR